MCILDNYTKLIVRLISIILIIFFLESVSIGYNYVQKTDIIEADNENIEIQEELNLSVNQTEEKYELNENFENNWYIEIPKIGLIAPISEGTTQEIMSKYVGHFEKTEVWGGNIGLAAHNRRMSCKLF